MIKFLLPWILASLARHGASWLSGVLMSAAVAHVLGSHALGRTDADAIAGAAIALVVAVWAALNKVNMTSPAVQAKAADARRGIPPDLQGLA